MLIEVFVILLLSLSFKKLLLPTFSATVHATFLCLFCFVLQCAEPGGGIVEDFTLCEVRHGLAVCFCAELSYS